MTKRKDAEAKPWCWYCDREFDDDKILIQHQKAKHFKCLFCNKKLNSASSMVIHIAQVHKQPIHKVPNALEARSDVTLQIFGMQGVPVQDLLEHYEAVGVNAEPVMKKLHLESHSYAHGPSSLTRTPGIGALLGTQLTVKGAEDSGCSRSAQSSLPPPLLAVAQGKKYSSSSISLSSPLLDANTEVTSPPTHSDTLEHKTQSQMKTEERASYACQRKMGKNCILVYSSEKSIEERRLQDSQ